MLEISTKKVPLRHMYDGSTFGMIGKLGDRIRDMECIGPYQYPKKELIEDIVNPLRPNALHFDGASRLFSRPEFPSIHKAKS